MPTLAQVKTRVNVWANNTVLPELAAKQGPYKTAKGRHWQGLRSHAGHVQHRHDGNRDNLADRKNHKPTDQDETWNDFMPTGFIHGPMRSRVTVDVYDGPQGHGYVLNLFFRYNNGTAVTRWGRSIGIGPEDRTTVWRRIIPETI